MTDRVPDELKIISADESRIPLILEFIRKLAEYEQLAGTVTADEKSLRAALFGSRPAAEVLIAYLGDEPAGFAVFFHSFSTFLGRSGIYLEDLFVEPAFRGRGVGAALLTRLAKLAKDRDCGRLEWAVLNWNVPAMNFYRKLGAAPLNDWTTFRLTGEALDRLAMGDNAGQ